jgi:hypothetical protein
MTLTTVDYEYRDGSIGGACPTCGYWVDLETDGAEEPENVLRHPSVPQDEPVECYCKDCQAGFEIDV